MSMAPEDADKQAKETIAIMEQAIETLKRNDGLSPQDTLKAVERATRSLYYSLQSVRAMVGLGLYHGDPTRITEVKLALNNN